MYHNLYNAIPEDQRDLMLGGEISMWSDQYCYTNQCGSWEGDTPVGHELYDPKNDGAFARSIGGMIWPKGAIGALSFWNAGLDPDTKSDAFLGAYYAHND